MITPAYVRTMAAYNAEMNRRLYAAAARLPDQERRADRGAFWHSIHGTLNHLLWADRTWMSRLAGWEKPSVPGTQSDRLIAEFAELRVGRERADADLQAWAESVDAAALGGELAWFSGALQRDVTADRGLAILHMFNHQTHHRGQVHALITRAGEKTGDTDLWIIVPNPID